ncbi:MAG: hypothetical protein MUP80_14695 [Acidobacteriia bacterium]|jgi:hypothetical protein|nr:hypothetical protein [Terriglobia bacterium]
MVRTPGQLLPSSTRMMLRGKTAQIVQEKTWAGKSRPGSCTGDSVVVTQKVKFDNSTVAREFVKYQMQNL